MATPRGPLRRGARSPWRHQVAELSGIGGCRRVLLACVPPAPAAGQGALGIEICRNHPELHDKLATLTHKPTWLAVLAERAVSRSLGGSCSMPLAAFAQWQDGVLHLEARLGHPDQPGLVKASLSGQPDSAEQADAMGDQAYMNSKGLPND